MLEPRLPVTVDANGDWCGSHHVERYLVNSKVHDALNEGLKTWHIEGTFLEGEDWVRVFDGDDLSDTLDSVTDLMNIQAACNPSEKERGKLLGMIDTLTVADLVEQLELFEEDIAGVMLEALYKRIASGKEDDRERIEKLSDNYRAFGDC